MVQICVICISHTATYSMHCCIIDFTQPLSYFGQKYEQILYIVLYNSQCVYFLKPY